MTKHEYTKTKLQLAPVAAVILLLIQLFVFITGLHIGGDWSFLVACGLWLSLLIIQLIGNDFGQGDTVFKVGWVFSYILEIGAGTYALYNIFQIPTPTIVFEFVRWTIAFGLSGVISLIPERLIHIYLEGPKIVRQAAPAQQNRERDNRTQRPDLRNAGNKAPLPIGSRINNPAKSWENKDKPKTYDPLNFPTQKSQGKPEQTYGNMRRLLEDLD